ncbi:MAG: ATP-binding protein DrrA1-3 family domain-containing protein [Bacillota bacterium]
MAQIPGVLSVRTDAGASLAVLESTQAMRGILAALATEDWSLERIEIVRPSLEDVYMGLHGGRP